jgi:epoxide hydrolase-like predicted phosphatase
LIIRAVVFDLGGVLVRTEDASGRERLAQQLGKTRLELEALVFSSDSGQRTQSGKLNDQQHWQNVANALHLTPNELGAFQKNFWGGDRLDRQLVEFIRSLRPKYKTGLLSNNYPVLRRLLREKWKIEDIFDTIVISAEVGLLKPDPRIYHLTLDQLGVVAGEAVFVDDFIHNLAGAEAVGMRTIHFKNSAQAQVDLLDLLNGND